MKKLIFIYTALAFISCNRYLEVMPDSALDITIDSEEKIAEILTAAYPKASYFTFLESRTDNVAQRLSGTQSQLNEAMYHWRDFDQDEPDYPLFYWNACYKGIAQANHALEYLKKYPKTDKVKALYAEAFLLRAYLHFMLVNIWANPYNDKTSATDPGIPYINKPEKNALPDYKRHTVKEVYDAIEEDLKYGLELVSDNYYAIPKYHFNKAAAYAFASRFYLYKGEWDKVIAYSDYVLGPDAYNIIRTHPHGTLEPERKAYTANYTSVNEPANLMITSTESLLYRNIRNDKYGFNSILSTEFRIFFKKGGVTEFNIWLGPVYPMGIDAQYMIKFTEFEKTGNTGSSLRNIYVMNNLFTTDEVLLNRAEAHAMKQSFDNATYDIRTFARKRLSFDKEPAFVKQDLLEAFPDAVENYTPFYTLTPQQASMVQAVAELRRRESIHEGLRWFDIKRFYLVVARKEKGAAAKLEKNDKRKVLQIPAEAIRLGLTPNPR